MPRQEARQSDAPSVCERTVVGVAVAPAQGLGAPHEQAAQQERELLGRERRVEQLEHQLGEQLEEARAVVGPLEVGPVAQQDGLEAVDQQVGVAEGVEVLAEGLDERRAHAVKPLDRLDERQVAVGDDHLLRRAGDIGAQGVGVEEVGSRFSR